MNTRADCIFCQIVSSAASSFPVFEDELTLCFLDLFPVATGHALVIPKEHFENVFEVSDEALRAVASTTRRVAHAIRNELNPEGLGLFQLNGAAAGQTVFHHHQHLIPRSSGDELKLHSRIRGDDEQLLALSRRLTEAL